MCNRLLVAIPLCVATFAERLAAQQDLADWLNARVDSLVAARVVLRDGTKQPQVPVGSGTDASLVDRAAMPDVAGIAVILPNQPASGPTNQQTAMSLSGTVYALWALLKGAGVLDPNFYLRSGIARRFGLSATFDTHDSAGTTSGLIQAKIVVLDRGNPLTGTEGRVSGALKGATDAYGRLTRAIQDILFERVGTPRGQTRVNFFNSLTQPAVFKEVLTTAGAQGLAAIDEAITRELAAFEALRSVVAAAVADSRRRPQLAIGVTTRTSGTFAQQFRAVLIFDYQARPSLDFTLNAGFEHLRATAAIAERTRFEITGQLLWRLTPDNRVVGRGPVSFTLAGSGAVDTKAGSENMFKLQGRLLIPIADGMNVPISSTWVSRTDVIDKNRVKGQVGFSFDLGHILVAAR